MESLKNWPIKIARHFKFMQKGFHKFVPPIYDSVEAHIQGAAVTYILDKQV